MRLILSFLFAVEVLELVYASKYADQLYEDLMYFYNKNVRPVKNTSEPLRVKFGASLIRIIDVDEVNQVLTTNLWMEMHWYDYKLTWDPVKFNNIKKIHIPADQLWIPDILLYNNADGEPHISIMSDAIVYYTGLVVWKPPSIYKSFCTINIEYFPYDEQSCRMKFGGWSYNGFLMDVIQLPSRPEDVIETRKYEDGKEYQFLETGMDLSAFYPSLEWDVMKLTSKRHEQLYPGCCGQDMYIDITFGVTLRRKTLFYTVNLVIPCMLIAILTTFVFYIPAIEHKCTFSISILVTLTVFYLVLIELIPPTSLVIPLIGKYLLFTMFLVTASILLSVVSINIYRRDGSMHPMPKWVHNVFLKTLPRYLCIKPPDDDSFSDDGSTASDVQVSATNSRRPSPYFLSLASVVDTEMRLSQLAQLRGMHPDVIRRMIDNIAFISAHFKALKKESKISEDWSYVAMVMDRCLLIIFAVLNLAGTILIFAYTPSLYDERQPLQVLPPSKPLSGDTYDYIMKSGNFTAPCFINKDHFELSKMNSIFYYPQCYHYGLSTAHMIYLLHPELPPSFSDLLVVLWIFLPFQPGVFLHLFSKKASSKRPRQVEQQLFHDQSIQLIKPLEHIYFRYFSVSLSTFFSMELSHGYLVVYFPETGEFSQMPARSNGAYIGKKYFITYEDREEPYMGVVKGICESEKQADDLIERFTNVDEVTLKILRQKIPSLRPDEPKTSHLSSKNIRYFNEVAPKPTSTYPWPLSEVRSRSEMPRRWYRDGKLVVENKPATIDMEKMFERCDFSDDKKMEKKLKLMKKKKST